MGKQKKLCIYTLLPIVFFLNSFIANSQEHSPNLDSLFLKARAFAFTNQQAQTRELCLNILQINPQYIDARILLGKTYAWQQKFDLALIELEKAWQQKNNYYDAIEALIDVETWSGNFKKGLFYADKGLSIFPADINFSIKKIRLLLISENFLPAKQEILSLLNREPENEEALQLLEEVKRKSLHNYLSAEYAFDYFGKPWMRRWHLMYVEYTRKTKLGKITGRIYLGDVVPDGESVFSENTGLLYEIEAYPKLSKNNYGYLSYGYSPDELFSKNRFALELYQNLPKAFEASFGTRYMQFRKAEGTQKDVLIYTGSLSKYVKKYRLSFRPYIIPASENVYQAYYFSARRYLRKNDNYLSLEFGKGNSPDNPLDFVTDFDLFTLKNSKIQFIYQQRFKNNWLININLGYQYEEYALGVFRNAYGIKFRLGYFF